MNMPMRAVNEHDEKRSSLIRSLSEFTKQHRAANWAGTFAQFLESVFPTDARATEWKTFTIAEGKMACQSLQIADMDDDGIGDACDDDNNNDMDTSPGMDSLERSRMPEPSEENALCGQGASEKPRIGEISGLGNF